MRSTRTITSRSPTASAISSYAAAQAGDAAARAMSSASLARGDTKVRGSSARTSRQQASKSAAQPRVWKPHAWWAAIPASTSPAMCSGSTRSHVGVANGVWLKWTATRSGRRSARPDPNSPRW